MRVKNKKIVAFWYYEPFKNKQAFYKLISLKRRIKWVLCIAYTIVIYHIFIIYVIS